MIKFLPVVILLFPLVCGVFLFSGETDKRIRTCLLLYLKRSYLKEPPLINKLPSVRIKPESKAFIFDIHQKLLSEFLDFTDFSSLSQIDSIFHDYLKRAVNQRLATFHPHFATEDSLVNNLLYCVLNENFRFIKSANDSLIHDHLQLLCAKYFLDDLDFSVIPSNIYYYIICFMFEMIYETDMTTPATKSEFLNQLVCSFRTCDYSLELTYNYVLSHYFIEDSSNGSDDFEFFYSKPSIEDIKSRFKIVDLRGFDLVTSTMSTAIQSVFKIAILEALLPEFSRNQLIRVYRIFSHLSTYHYSPELIELVHSHQNLSSQIANVWAYGKYHSVALHAFKLLDSSGSRFIISELVSNINPTNLLKMEDLDAGNLDHLLCLDFIAFRQLYSLSKIDACSKLIIINHQSLKDKWLSKCLQNSNLFAIEILVKEGKVELGKEALKLVSERASVSAVFMRFSLGILNSEEPFTYSILKMANKMSSHLLLLLIAIIVIAVY
jgi:hypothetical protein